MRIQSKLLMLAAAVAVLWAGSTLHAQTPFSITISPSHDGVSAGDGIEKAGSPIYVLAEVKNDSGKTVSSSQWDYDEYYTFDVRDAEGYPASETELMRKWKDPGRRKNGHGLISHFKTGESWHEQLYISKFYDMSRPGTYTIQLERQRPEELGVGTVISNTITITVLPADGQPPTQK